MEDLIVNRVASSGLVQLDLEDWYDARPRKSFDISDFLFQGLILKEQEFRAALKAHDWEQYRNCHLAVFCSADAIVPTWAFMLVATYAATIVASLIPTHPDRTDDILFDRWIQSLDIEPYRGARVIVKGCSKHPVPLSAYIAISERLTPVVQSLMFGEPCSNVPLYKKKKETPPSA